MQLNKKRDNSLLNRQKSAQVVIHNFNNKLYIEQNIVQKEQS